MTDEKKNDEKTEIIEEKKSVSEEKGKEKKAEVKAETEKVVAKEETTEKADKEIKKEAGSSSNNNEPAQKEVEAKSETSKDNKEKDDSEKVEGIEKKVKKDLGNLNYYSELRSDIPEIRSGDISKVFYRVVEGGKERVQIFEGTVIAIKNGGIAKTITVRKTSFGISIERIFPLNSKLVQKIEIIKHSRVRRAKLYYLRKLKGKAARLKELR